MAHYSPRSSAVHDRKKFDRRILALAPIGQRLKNFEAFAVVRKTLFARVEQVASAKQQGTIATIKLRDDLARTFEHFSTFDCRMLFALPPADILSVLKRTNQIEHWPVPMRKEIGTTARGMLRNDATVEADRAFAAFSVNAKWKRFASHLIEAWTLGQMAAANSVEAGTSDKIYMSLPARQKELIATMGSLLQSRRIFYVSDVLESIFPGQKKAEWRASLRAFVGEQGTEGGMFSRLVAVIATPDAGESASEFLERAKCFGSAQKIFSDCNIRAPQGKSKKNGAPVLASKRNSRPEPKR